MRSKVVRMLALALVLGGVSIVVGQPPGSGGKGGKSPPGEGKEDIFGGKKAAPAKSKLEEMLDEALKNNPDIRVAAAKLAEADAELNRTRLQVMQKVVTLYHTIETQKTTVARWESEAKKINEQIKRGIVDHSVLAETEQQLALAKGKLEELEAQLPALLGKSVRAQTDTGALATLALRRVAEGSSVRLDDLVISVAGPSKLITLAEWEKRFRATGPMSERLRKALQTPVKVNYSNIPLKEAVKDLMKKAPGLSIHCAPRTDFSIGSLSFEEPLPVSAVLQALEDDFNFRFIIRDYGILVPDPQSPPPGALTLQEFLRQKPADEPRRPSSGGKNPPVESVEGVIKSIDKGGLLLISIGSDAGLAKGQTLELFWMPHKPPINDARSFGTVRIVEVETHQAVAQPVGGLSRKPQQGDRIIGQIQKK
jgi:hypothetical protein